MVYDNRFFQFVNKLVDAAILALLCVLYSLPIVTVGAALTAFYAQALRVATDTEGQVVRGFHRAFCANFKRATLCYLALLAAAFVLAVDWFYFVPSLGLTGIGGIIAVCIFFLACALVLLTALYLFPTLARFENPFLRSFWIAGFMAVRHFAATLLSIGALVCAYFATIHIATGLFFLWFGWAGLAQSAAYAFVFRRYEHTENTPAHS